MLLLAPDCIYFKPKIKPTNNEENHLATLRVVVISSSETVFYEIPAIEVSTMNFEVSSRFDQEDFCRLCMCSIYELQALFPRGATIRETNAALVTKINLLVEIIMVPSDEQNSRICSRCIQQLEDFDSFRRRCKDSDSQIRQIRAFRQGRADVDSAPNLSARDRPSVTSSQKPTDEGRIGGIFNSMQYCVDKVVAGEYRLLYNGHVYRWESLLVWRCEFSICPCKLLVQHDCSKVLFYAAHSHGKTPLGREGRKFEGMNQRISDFLIKLRDQMDGNKHGSSAPHGSQQLPVSSTQPTTSMTNPVSLLYNTGGVRPTIVVSGHKYYKEAASASVMCSQNSWRCSEKNCLGMIMTAADLTSYRVLKNHSHEPKAVFSMEKRTPARVTPTVHGTPLQCAFPANAAPEGSGAVATADRQVSVVPHDNVSGGIASNTSQLRQDNSVGISKSNFSSSQTLPILDNVQPTHSSGHAQKESEPLVTSTASSNQQKNGSGKRQKEKSTSPKKKKLKTTAPASDHPVSAVSVQFYRSEARTFYMRFDRRFYYKDFSDKVTSPDLDIVWRCVVMNCPGSMTLRANMKAVPGPVAHNHGFFTGDPDRLTTVSPLEALQKLPIVPNIAFCRSPATQGVCLLYKRFMYSLNLRHLTNGFFIWQCNITTCSGWIHSGTEFEYLIPGGCHNHLGNPERSVDGEHHVPVLDALRRLSDLKNRSQNSIIASLSESSKERDPAEAELPPEKKSRMRPRRKSTWC